MVSRRRFLGQAATLGLAGTANIPLVHGRETSSSAATVPQTSDLCGTWQFSTDADRAGLSQRWFAQDAPAHKWTEVNVPHTWQIDPVLADFRGVAWYRRTIDAPQTWANSIVRIQFEAVFHTATVWVNGQLAGEHLRKGYTSFTFDITSLLQLDKNNVLVVRVDSAFNEHMLPRGQSSDWANDGGIYRPVQLLLTPKVYVERVRVRATPNLQSGEAKIEVTGYCRNAGSIRWAGQVSFQIVDDQTGLPVLTASHDKDLSLPPGSTQEVQLQRTLPNPKLWHFDHPNLYRLQFLISGRGLEHQVSIIFGIRTLEVKGGQFYLNGEHVRLMGVERMAGSNPEYGTAEPTQWIVHDHDDLKHLNCVFTRVHWPQDKRVLDYCDRHGILMQTEVPAWGGDTFKGMSQKPDADIMENGLEQLREMIAQDGNHPSVVMWGMCNEIYGQNPPAFEFAKRMLAEAKRLDPDRLCSYASNSLGQTPQRDVAGLMDVIETNEYFGSWQEGPPEAVSDHLDQLHAAFPDKPIVVSEYGYCACTDDRPEGDEHRIQILQSHDKVIRSKDYMGGAIFFCYNDYRTHMGNRGSRVLQQNVHGVVDVYGARKPSFEVLRNESSPVESLVVTNHLNSFTLRLNTRRSVPAYILSGYKLQGVFYGDGSIPIECRELELPDLQPGTEAKNDIEFSAKGVPLWVRFDVLRPTGFSAYTLTWKP